MVLVNKLDDILKAKNIGIEDLAYTTKLTRMTIFNACRGNGVTLNTAMLIARSLNVKIEDIWQEAESDSREEEAA